MSSSLLKQLAMSLAVIFSGTLLASCGASAPSVPTPQLSAFLPANYRVSSVLHVDLDGSGKPQEAVSAVSPGKAVSDYPTFATSIVFLIAWDPLAKRWTEVFNTLHLPWWQTSSQSSSGPGLLNLTNQAPQLAVLHDQPNKTADLLFWVNSLSGNTDQLLVGIVHYENQIATLEYTYSGHDGHVFSFDEKSNDTTGADVIGSSPNQRVIITQPWLTGDDSESTAARMYSFEIAPVAHDFDSYHVVSDNIPYVGVELNDQSVVERVAMSSPSAGRLEVGDVVIGVEGSTLSRTDIEDLIGPPVIEEVALYYPGDVVRLRVRRNGRMLIIPVLLGAWPTTSAFFYGGDNYFSVILMM